MMKKRTPSDYKFIRLIGEGSFSSVYLAVDAGLQAKQIESQKVRKYAIKVCQKSHIKRQGKQAAIMREKEIMNILNQSPCERFIRLYCTFQDVERLYFVMSYAEHGELLTYMQQNPLSLNRVRKFTLQLLEALECMHKLGIVHRDLKPENILLGEHLNILISDFGSAQIYNRSTNYVAPSPIMTPQLSATPLTSNHSQAGSASQTTPSHQGANNSNNDKSTPRPETNPSMSTATPTTPAPATHDRRSSFVGTAQYVSPEMLRNREASNKSDLWALGAIIYQMITNVMPFDAPNEYLIYKKIQSLDYNFPEHFDGNAKDMITRLLKLEPQERLGAEDDFQEGYHSIRMHSFLTDLDETEFNSAITERASVLHDPDLSNIDNIVPGLDETQLLRLLTDA